MLFIGFAILVAGLLGLLIASDAGSLIGLQQDQFGHLLFLLILLLFFSASMFSRRIRASQVLGGVLMWGAVFLVAVGAYTYRFEIQHVGSRILGELVPGTFRDDTRREFIALIERLKHELRIDGVILGGTELPILLKSPTIAGLPMLDTTELHVNAIVRRLAGHAAHADHRPAGSR